jgi:formylglycine-generating enzyme required for sulfatase activity
VAAGLAVAFALAFVLLGALRDPPKHAGVDVERAPAAAPATPNTPVAPAAPIDAPAASGDAPAAPAAPGVSGDAPAAAPASAAAPAKLPAPLVVPNQWVRIDPPPVPYRLGVADTAPPQQVGFRASRGILTPSRSYEIHEHEVTWSELEPWLEPWLARRHEKVVFPSWATDPGERAGLPATGIKWDTALEYCRSLGGPLPTEGQWEYAARGAEQRPNPWGADPLDRQITNAYAGPNAQPWPAIWSRQDRTPYRPRVYDLAGNVQEWTLGLWREDRPGKEESSASVGQTTSRAIRGLPLAEPPPPSIQPAASAYRERLCATGPCVEKTRKRLAYIGFRCARPLD